METRRRHRKGPLPEASIGGISCCNSLAPSFRDSNTALEDGPYNLLLFEALGSSCSNSSAATICALVYGTPNATKSFGVGTALVSANQAVPEIELQFELEIELQIVHEIELQIVHEIELQIVRVSHAHHFFKVKGRARLPASLSSSRRNNMEELVLEFAEGVVGTVAEIFSYELPPDR